MTTIPTSQSNPQFSDIVTETPLSNTVDSTARTDGQTVLSGVDNRLADLIEDFSIMLSGGGLMSFDGTNLTFTEDIKVELTLKRGSGTNQVPVINTITVASNSPLAISNDQYVYSTFSRDSSANITLTAIDASTGLPALKAGSNVQTFIFAIRRDAGDGVKTLYLRNGQSITEGQSVRLGASGSGSGAGGELNYIKFPNEVGSGDYGWKESTSGQVDIETTYSSSEIPIPHIFSNALKISATGSSGSDYVYIRFVRSDADKYSTFKIEWFQKIISAFSLGDFSLVLYYNEASDYSGTYHLIESTNIPISTQRAVFTFYTNNTSYNYFEVRINKNTAVTSKSFALNNVTLTTGVVTLPSNIRGGTVDRNYVIASTFNDNNKNGYLTYKDAASAIPEDGTGGSPLISFDISGSSATLFDSYGKLSKGSGSSKIGEGVAYTFNIKNQDRAKVLNISFDYVVEGDYFVRSSDNLTPSSVTIWIYDVTNSALIQPSCIVLDGSGTFNTSFQTASNASSFRLLWHCSTPETESWNLYIDNVYIGRKATVQGVPASDTQIYSPVITGTSTPGTMTYSVNTGEYSRIGDSLFIRLRFGLNVVSSAPSGSYYVNLPPGLSIDTNKIPTTDSLLAMGHYFDSSASGDARFIPIRWRGYSADPTKIEFIQGDDHPMPTFSTNDFIEGSFIVPILGWSSNVAMSSDAETRVVAFEAKDVPTAITWSTAAQPMIFPSPERINDTHNKYSTSTGGYTIPVSGWYHITMNTTIADSGGFADGEYVVMGIGINSTSTTTYQNSNLAAGNENQMPASWNGTVKLEIGDVIYPLVASSGTSAAQSFGGTALNHSFFVCRASGPAVIAASEKIAFDVHQSSNQAISTETAVSFDGTPVINTHGALSSGVFTAPRAGLYYFSANIGFTVGASVPAIVTMKLYQNSTAKVGAYEDWQTFVNGKYYKRHLDALLELQAGDTVSIKAQATTNTVTIWGSGTETRFKGYSL